MLIKRVYEIDPLACPKCGGQMAVVAFIEPPQGSVIEKILRHCGLWDERPPPGDCPDYCGTDAAKMGLSPFDAQAEPEADDEPGELTFVDIDTFEATF
jgi:hypothetical protein